MNNNAKINALVENIIGYLKDNEGVLTKCIEELDDYNGYLGDDRYYPMDELNELYNGSNPIELLQRAFYGRDDDTWHTDSHGEKVYGSFNPNREYFYFNGYGNLVSSDYKDYSYKLDGYLVESLAENRYYIDTIDDDEELAEMFEELIKELDI